MPLLIDALGDVRLTEPASAERPARGSERLGPGTKLATGPKSRAVIRFDDGSKIEVGPQSDYWYQEEASGAVAGNLSIGSVRCWVTKLQRRFTVRTQAVTAAVRGTEFSVEVPDAAITRVEVMDGSVQVTDLQGRSAIVEAGQRLDVGMGGLAAGPQKAKTYQSAPPASSLQEAARREVGLDMSKEELLAAAAREIKLAEYQQGKALIDINGQRVRLEEYVLRPAEKQFKLVVLNERAQRFDYFYYLGTFNKALPADLSVALRQIGGGLDVAPEYFLTAFETGRSNTIDSMRELAQGGHQVNVNGNADGTDNINSFLDQAQDRDVDSTGRPVFQTLYDRYGFYVNGTLKYGWTGANLQTYGAKTWSTTADPITGAALGRTLPVRSAVSSFANAGLARQVVFESYSDGTSITWDNYIIGDDGKVADAAEFSGLASGAAFKSKLLDFNYEQVITATEFQGRKIDLVVAPKILIQTGLIP